jgi:hypothetical protein
VAVLRAVLLMVPVFGTIKLTVRVTVVAFAKLAIAGKVTSPVIGSYTPPSEAETPVKPEMMLSVITTLVALLGPRLLVAMI